MSTPLVVVSDITDTSLEVSWADVLGDTAWIPQMRRGGGVVAPWEDLGQDLSYAHHPANVFGLQPGTAYSFRLRSPEGNDFTKPVTAITTGRGE